MEPGFLAWLVRQAGNHLWQSTAFAAVAFVVAVALKATHARARHWVWLAASVKFLVPFGVLASLGGVIGSRVVPAAPAARVPFTVAQVVQPFALPQEAVPVVAASASGSAGSPVAAVLLAIWFIGFAAVLFRWWNRWRHVRAVVRASVPLQEGREADALRRLGSDVELVSSEARLEPGAFGILRPMLWLPAGIADRLSEAELEAILAHELCHLRRRDNLWAAVHMVVEAVFWFHPLVWWLGARLVEERERACDEEVVRLGCEPQAYAEGVLKVCEFYLESPLPCAAGVTGADLKKRIEGIMESRFINELCFWKKSLLAVLLAAAVACPFLLGVFKAEAQTPARPSAQFESNLEFEVASVKPAPPPSGGSMTSGWGGGPNLFSCENMDLASLVRVAYGARFVSMPDWMSRVRFNIEAKMPKWTTRKQQNIMLRNLLISRFKLAAHYETRQQPTYSLLVAKNGPKFKQAGPARPAVEDRDEPLKIDKDGYPVPSPGRPLMAAARNHLRMYDPHMTMAELANDLSHYLHGPVTDATGLTGLYEIDLRWVEDTLVAEPEKDPGPRLIDAVAEQLGLRLGSKKGPVEYLVVDHAEKVPTEN